MKRITCLNLLLSRLMALCVPQHQYVIVKAPKTWYDAQSYCRDNGCDLATINDMGEMMTALTVVKNKYNDAVWTGIQKGSTLKWYWSLADNDFYKEGERNYFIWGNNANYNCAAFKDGKLYMVTCAQINYAICFNGSQQDVQQQYVVSTTKMTWTVARDYCRTNYTDLVSVRNQEESLILQEVVAGSLVWIGLFRDPWIWSDQTYSSFRYWKPSESVFTDSSVTCGALLKSESGKWGDLLCDQVQPFLCSCPITRFIKMRISSQGAELDLNEPAVQDGILQQIKQELCDKNVTNVIQLNWKKHPDGRVFNEEPNTGG